MKDWKEWFRSVEILKQIPTGNLKTNEEEHRYQAYKARLIEEGFIEANPKRWVRPKESDVEFYFADSIV